MNKNSVNNTNDFDVTIIGGGAIGVSIAYKLSKSKFRCAIVEKNTIGSGATQAAAGIISPLFYGDINLSDTLNTCLLYTSPSPRDQRGSGVAAWGC